MEVLLSIKPQYAEAILSGRKRYEYRRTIFKRPGVQRVIIYASTPVRRIVGEFCVEEIIEAPPMMLWARTAEGSGLRKSQFEAYFAGKETGYAIRVHAPGGKAHTQHRNRKPFIVFARSCAPNITLRTARS